MIYLNKFFQRTASAISIIVLLSVCIADAGIINPDSNRVIAVRSRNMLYIRTAWSDLKDMVQMITLDTDQEYSNNVVNFSGVRLIPRYTPRSDTETVCRASADVIAVQDDDAAPLNYNGTYIGADHGPLVIQQLTAAAHGKKLADIGSEWIDGNNVKWYIMRIVDAGRLWVLSQNFGSAQWRFAGAVAGSTLTHSSGAAHTGRIKFTAAATTQLCPITASHTKKVLLNGCTEICEDGTYTGNSLIIQESYSIPDIGAVLTYVKSRAGRWINPPRFNEDGLTESVRMNIVYQFNENGSCTVFHAVRTCQDTAFNYAGGVQAAVLEYSSRSIDQYIPKTLPVAGRTKVWNFAAAEDITGGVDNITFPPSTWSNAGSPPDRMAQIVRSGAIRQYGFILGYSPVRGLGQPSQRVNSVNDALCIYMSKKQYPRALTGRAPRFSGGIVPAGSYFEIVAYRCFFNSEKLPESTVFTWYYDGPDVVVIMDFHQSVTLLNVPLPAEFTGRRIEIIEASSSFTLASNDCLSPAGLRVTVNKYGYAIIKLGAQ